MLKFTEDHEWLRVEGDIATVGITDYAQGSSATSSLSSCRRLAELAKGAAAAVVESVKAASDVYAPMSGEITQVNEAIVQEPQLVNSDAMGKGWFFKIRIANASELAGLMDEAAYRDLVG